MAEVAKCPLLASNYVLPPSYRSACYIIRRFCIEVIKVSSIFQNNFEINILLLFFDLDARPFS